jgi:hypothetical protein
MNEASALETSVDFRSRRFRCRVFLVAMCFAKAWLRFSFPVAVLRNLFAAPRWVFSFFFNSYSIPSMSLPLVSTATRAPPPPSREDFSLSTIDFFGETI